MRKYFVLCALALAALVSCNKEMEVEKILAPETVKEGYVALTLTADCGQITKSTIEGKSIVWAVGDELAVFADGAGQAQKFAVLEVAVEGGKMSGAKFSGSVPEGTQSIVAVYPYSAAVSCAEDVVTLDIPEVQTIPDEAVVDPKAMPSVAVYSDLAKSETFQNVMSLLKFNVKGVANVSEVTISVGDAFLAGQVEATLSEGAAPVIESKCDKSVTVKSESFFDMDLEYYAVVAPVAKAGGITVKSFATGKVGIRASENAVSFERNVGLNLGSIVENASWKYSEIWSGEDFADFLKTADTYEEEDVVTVCSGLNLSGIELTSANSFKGTLDGGNYAISNWTSEGVSLFEAVSGTVKNLTIDKSCKLRFPEEIDSAFGFVAKQCTGTLSGVTVNADAEGEFTLGSTVPRIAVIVGWCNAADEDVKTRGIVVENCVNNGNVDITLPNGVTGATTYIGTVLGSMGNSKNNSLRNCANHGNLSVVSAATDGNNLYMGGVAGGTTNGSNNINVTNTGDVTFKTPYHAKGLCLSGITSYTTGLIDGCSNSGKISYVCDAGIGATFVSGIAGYFASNTMINSENRGDVTINAGYIKGRNSIGDIDGSLYNGNNALTAGLTIGGLVSATGKNPVFEDSANYGNVSLTITDPMNADVGTHTAARPSMGGCVGDCSGPMTNVENHGDVTVIIDTKGQPLEAKNAGYTLWVGGIVGSSYNFNGATTKGGKDTNARNKFTLDGCKNYGRIYASSYNTNTTNHTVGGIVGWPMTESQTAVYVARNCENYGEVVFEGGAKARLGGIHGGTGRIENCVNEGKILMIKGDAGSVLGGLCGFISQGHTISGTVNCTVEAQCPVNAVGGLIGNQGNVAAETAENTSVKATLIGGPEGKTGLVVGLFNGSGKAITLGSEDSPIKVSGSVNGEAVTADNFQDMICGATNYTPADHIVYASFGE